MLTPTICLGVVKAMPIKSKQADLIYKGCLICQAIDDFESFLSDQKIYNDLLNEDHFKRILLYKDKWVESLAETKD